MTNESADQQQEQTRASDGEPSAAPQQRLAANLENAAQTESIADQQPDNEGAGQPNVAERGG